MGRNAICRSLIAINGVLRILVINNSSTMYLLLTRLIRRNFNSNATGTQFNAYAGLVCRCSNITVNYLRRVLRIRRIEEMNARIILRALFIASICRSILRGAYLKTLTRQSTRSTLRRVLGRACNLRTCELASDIESQSSRSTLVLYRNSIR